MKSKSILLVLAVAACTAFAGTLQEAYTLRLDLKPATTDKYKIELDSTQHVNFPGAPPEIAVKGSMDFEMKTNAVDKDGLAEIEMKTSNVKLDAGQAAGMINTDQLPKEITVKAKLDSRNHITESKTEGLTPQAQMMMSMSGTSTSTMFVELPDKPVKVGDTWEIHLPKNPMMGDKEYPLIATLIGLEDYEGTPAYKVGITGKIEFDVDLGAVMKKMAEAGAGATGAPEGMDMKMKGSVDIGGTAFLARAGAKTLGYTMKMGSKQVLTMMGMDVNIDGVSNVNMKLAK
jgi:hypothetical protein